MVTTKSHTFEKTEPSTDDIWKVELTSKEQEEEKKQTVEEELANLDFRLAKMKAEIGRDKHQATLNLVFATVLLLSILGVTALLLLFL